jgi:putative transposase
VDAHTGKSFEHRRQWIVDRIKELTDIFAIDSCAYSVLSNHYHVIVHVDAEQATGWSEQQVIERWERLFSLPVIVQRYRAMETVSRAELDAVSELVVKWRSRLHDISWLIRCINEPIARQANQEDGRDTGAIRVHLHRCKGRETQTRPRSGRAREYP